MQSPKTKQPLHPVLTVSQLTGQIKDVVEELFDNVYVVGEVSNAKAYPSGHWYFSLKDKDATLPCVCFKSANSGIKFKLEDGLMLVAQGSLSIYPPKGGYQMVAASLEPVGVGEWQLAFEQLRAALEKEGLLDPARKKPIPTVPRRIGIVTSPAAAALRDILTALSRRNKNVNVVISPTRVQGEGSAEEIAQAIRDLQTLPGIEVIIVARGGGSIEDLWSFNTEVVARAVAACPIPIVCGVGHETDTTICDLVADLRAPTPTAAAEMVARGSQELLEKYKNLEQKLVFKIDQRLSKARRQLERLSPINALTRYQGRLKQYQMRVGHHRSSIERSVLHLVKNLHGRWQQKHIRLLALAPTNILNRGFAILRKLDGTVVCDPSSVQPGEELQAILKTGSLYLHVAAVQESLFAMLDPRPSLGEDSLGASNFEAAMIASSATRIELDPKTTFSVSEDVLIAADDSRNIFVEHSMLQSLSTESGSFDSVVDESGSGDADSLEEDCLTGIIEVCAGMETRELEEEILLEQIIDDSLFVNAESAEVAQVAQDTSDSGSLFISETVSTVFDSELADPMVLATIFGEDLADANSASVIFKATANSERLEIDALNAELTKDDIPPLETVSTQSAANPTEDFAPTSGGVKEYPDGSEVESAPEQGALFVEEHKPELELVVAGAHSYPVASRSKSIVESKSNKRAGKVAAHQLNLFKSNDDE